jgi:trehalose utilization protein
MNESIRVTVWNEDRHEKNDPQVMVVYPQGIHAVLAELLTSAGFDARTATWMNLSTD